MSTIARNFNVGVELHEQGMNLISQTIYEEHPEWFTHTESLVVDEISGRTLTTQVFITEYPRFNFFPAGNQVEIDQFFIFAKAQFTISDCPGGSEDGCELITRINANLEALCSLPFDGQTVAVKIDNFQVTGIEADYPVEAPPLPVPPGHIERSFEAAFKAIILYLVDVFLEPALREPIAQFPIPPLHESLSLPAPLTIYLRGLHVFSDRMALYLKHDSGNKIDRDNRNPYAPASHIGIGVVEETANRALRAYLPRTFPADAGRGAVKIRGNFTILESSKLDLIPPNVVGATIFFQSIDFRVNIAFRAFGYNISVDIPFPIGPGSHVKGDFVPNLVVLEDKVELIVQPTQLFFSPQNLGDLIDNRIVIVTNYRELFQNAVRNWLRSNVSPVLKKVPILGWIISKGVEVIVGEIMSWFVGAWLDLIISPFFTSLATVLFWGMKAFFSDKIKIRLLEFSRTLPATDIELNIERTQPIAVVENAGGELIIGLDLGSDHVQPIELPEPSEPRELDPVDTPGSGRPPRIYPPESFEPVFPIRQLTWQGGEEFRYAGELAGREIFQRVRLEELSGPARWRISCSTTDKNGLVLSVTVVTVDKNSLEVLDETQTSYVRDQDSTALAVTTNARYDLRGGTVEATARISNSIDRQIVINTPGLDKTLLSSDCWFHFLMTMDLQLGSSGTLGRLDWSLEDFSNQWVRFLPIRFEVAQNYERLQLNGHTFNALKVTAFDDENDYEIYVEERSRRRILKVVQKIIVAGGDVLTLTIER